MTFELTHLTATRGRYTTHPEVGYVLTPWFNSRDASHNGRGLRRGAVSHRSDRSIDGETRLVLLGASTVYGIYVKDAGTSAAHLERMLRAEGHRATVFNAGVPGWTSRETLLSLPDRALATKPHIAVVIDGRNDAFAQLWNGYRDDYSHYRDPDYELRASNRRYKEVFRISHLAMYVIAEGEWLGFSRRAEHPLYGAIDYAALPSPTEALAAAGDPARAAGFEQNLREMVRRLRGEGVAPALATVPFRPEGFASGVFEEKALYIDAITRRVRANNNLVRRLAEELGIPLADLETLSLPGLLYDDCHFNDAGEERAAELLRDAVLPLLSSAAAAGPEGAAEGAAR